MLCLEGQQAGLSWLTILKRIPAYHAAFADLTRYSSLNLMKHVWNL
jgi:3-methyladenine DNA glycosylase